MRSGWMLILIVGLSSCALPSLERTGCHKDYSAMRARDLAIMERGEQLQSAGSERQLSAEEQEVVQQARTLRQSRSLVADRTDVEIIDRARTILSSETVWDRADDRVCQDSDSTFSLFCALHRATRELAGRYEHRRTALQEVRFAVDEATAGRNYEHRMRDYNNDPATSLASIHAVLAAARLRLMRRLSDQRRCRL